MDESQKGTYLMPNAMVRLFAGLDDWWPFVAFRFEEAERKVSTGTKPERVYCSLPGVESEDDLLAVWTAAREFRQEHEALGHVVTFEESYESGGYSMKACWDEPLTDEELSESRQFIASYLEKHDNKRPSPFRLVNTVPIPMNTGQTLKWRRSIPFEVSTKENND